MGVHCLGAVLLLAFYLLAGAVFCSWFDLYVIPFICCFLLFVIVVVVFLCCPEVQASVQDFVRDGKRNYLLLTSKMPVMSKICCLALRFLSLLLVPVLGGRQLRVAPESGFVSLMVLGSSVLPWCSPPAAPQFP